MLVWGRAQLGSCRGHSNSGRAIMDENSNENNRH
jgi:hypothetical protein